MRARVPDNVKRLHGTFAPSRARGPDAPGVSRLQYPVPPPKDLDPEMRAAWRNHMHAVIAGGRSAPSDLLAFRQLVRAAVLVDAAMAQALAAGPTEEAEEGSKISPAWRAYTLADATYRGWLIHFGLTPRSRQAVKTLPGLIEVEAGQDD